MYRNFFGLRSLPFEDRADTQFFYPTAECEESLAALEYEIQYGSGMALLIGEAGTGKTLLLRTLLLRLQKTDQSVVITWPANGALDLLRECCKGFGVTLSSSQNQTRLLSRLRRHLGRSAGAGNRSILIIDQAENLSSDNIAQLATLADLYGDRGKLLNIIVAAQPLVRSLLDRPEFARIRQHLFGERLLSPLTATETGDYIHHRLRISGAGDANFFDHQAISLIHRLSGGIPRLVNRICNAAMLGAYSAQTKRITSIVVHETTSSSSATSSVAIARDTARPAIEAMTPWPNAGQVSDSTVDENTESADFDLSANPDNSFDTNEAISGATMADNSYETIGNTPPVTDVGKETILLARLERAAAHAERMTSTTEASITRLTAVEKHLATLVEQAERVMESLAPSIQQEIETLDRTERRLLEIGARAERHTNDAEAGLVRVSGLVSQADASTGRVERACKAAADVESRLTAFAERLGDQADQVQRRVSTLLEGVEKTETAQSRLVALVSQADSMTQAAQESIAVIKSQARSAIDEVGQKICLHGDAEMDRCNRQLQALIHNHEESRKVTGEKVQAQLDALLRRVSNAVSDAEITVERQRIAARETGEAVASRVDALLQKVSSNISTADVQAAQLECAAKETVESARTKLNGTMQGMVDVFTQKVTATITDADKQAIQLENAAKETVESGRSKLDGVLRSVSTATADAQRQVDALTIPLKSLLTEGERFERLLTVTLPRRCQEEHDAHLDRIRTALSAELASVEQAAGKALGAARSQLQGIVGQASSVVEGAERSYDAHLDRFRATLSAELASVEQAAGKSLGEARSQLQGILGQASSVVEGAGRSADLIQEKLISVKEDGNSYVKQLMETLPRRCQEEHDAHVDRFRTTLSAELASVEQAAAKALGAAHSKLQGILGEASSLVEDAGRNADLLSAKLRSVKVDGDGYVKQLMETLPRHCQEEHDTHLDRFRSTASAELASVEQAAGKTLGAARSQMQDILGQASSVVEDAGRSADLLRAKLISVKEDGEGYVKQMMETLPARCREEINNLTDDANSQLDGLREQLDEISNRRDETHSALSALESKTQASLEGFGSRAQAVMRPLVDAVQKGEQLQITAERIGALQQQVANTLIDIGIGCERASVARAQAAECERLAAANEGWRDVAEQLTTTISSARQIHEALLGLVAHADEKVSRMASHHSAASHILDRLYTENVAAHKVAERISSAANTVEDLVNKAQSQIDKIVALTESGQSLSDRISAVNETAAARCESLDRSSGAANQLIEHQERLCVDAQSASERLVSGVADARSVLHENQSLLEDFTAHAESMKARFEELHAKASEIENRVAESTAIPSAIVEDAHAQAAQLERVCGAVRKVFANLADSTLQAQRQTKGLREAEKDASVRLLELTAETQRAAHTLHEWVQEALRTQSRLEQTLGECPSIRETHPIETVQRLSRTSEPFARLGSQGVSGELQVLHEPDEEEDIEPMEAKATKPLTRAEEIARLINDAKQQEAAPV